jgi:hypothetical protein
MEQRSPSPVDNEQAADVIEPRSSICDEKYKNLTELVSRELTQNVITSLNRCARWINKEKIHDIRNRNGKQVIEGELEHGDPDAEKLVQMARRNLSDLHYFYKGHSFYLRPRNKGEQVVEIPNVTAIDTDDEKLVLIYKPNGETKTYDISGLGIDFSISMNLPITHEPDNQ